MERGGGHLGQNLSIEAVKDSQCTPLGDPTDHRRSHLPASTDDQHSVEALGLDDGQHPLLGLAGHDLVGLHAGLAPRHGRNIDVHAHATTRRRFAGGTRQPGAAQILDTDDQALVQQLETGLDETLFLIGVTHLHAGTLVLVIVDREASRSQHTDPTDAVAARTGAQ